MSANVFDRFDVAEEQSTQQQASRNVFDQFDGGTSSARQAEGNAFDRFDTDSPPQEAANETVGSLEVSDQSVTRPMGSGDINVFGDASAFTQEAIEGWGAVANSQAFRQGDWQTRQRMRGDYLDNTLRSRLSGPEYSQALEAFMNATGDDVFRPDRLLRSQSLNAGYGGGLADQRALQERRQAQADNSGMGLQLPGQSQPGVAQGEANNSPERAQVEGESQESGSILTDFGNLLSMGADRAALNTREVVRKTLGEGVVASIDRADEWLNGKESEALLSERIERNESELTTGTTEARGKAWWDSEKGELGPAWSDWRSYFSGITESLPETAMTMAPSMMLSKGVYAWNTARGVAPKLAAKRAATTATLAGGLSEGLLGGAASSREVRDSIRNMPEEQLRESGAIQSLMSEGGLTFEQARDTLAEDASSQAFVTSGVITGAFGGMGDRALAGIITGGPTSRLGAALRGAAGEGIFEEMPQEAGQQASENLAMRRADESIGVLDDVPNAALGGLAIGASMGAGMGAAAGGRREPSNQEGQPQEAGQTGERRENSSDAEFERVWREHERENNLEPIDLQQDTGVVIDIAPNVDLIRTPRHELSSAEREARDSLTYGNDFKTLRAAAEQKGDTDAVAELDAISEQVSGLLEAEALSRTRGEPLSGIRERLDVAADRFAQVVERINSPEAGGNTATGLDIPEAFNADQEVEQTGEAQAAREEALKSNQPSENPDRIMSQRVPVERIQIDPEAYQFRSNVNQDGVDSRLEGVEKWDDLRAGNLVLHERLDGTLYAADGHHRINLARQLGQPDVNALILREADGVTVEEARIEAATANIAAGSATAMDAAKVFRNTNIRPSEAINRFDLPRKSPLVRDGIDIAKLGNDAFGAVLNGVVNEKDGATIGRAFSDPDQQMAAVDVFQRVQPTNDNQRALLANEVRQAGFAQNQGEQGGLFGDDPAESLIGERVRVMDSLRQTLVRDRRLFSTLNENALTAEQAGNRIAKESNDALHEASSQAVALLERATTTPKINQQINDAARRVKDGEALASVTRELKEALLNGSDTAAAQQPRTSAPSSRPANQTGQDAGRSEPVPEGDNARAAGTRQQRVGDDAGQPQAAVTLKADGKPFQTRKAVELSKRFRDTSNAQPIEVDGGWGFISHPSSDMQANLPADTAEPPQLRDIKESIEVAATQTDLNPTQLQAEAGNYRKGRVKLKGLDIAIENPKGSTRRGTRADGTQWESQMAHHYGDIKGTKAADGDNLDVFVGDNPGSSNAYIIDQLNEEGSFDEHKIMLGFDSPEAAQQGYLANYEDGWQGLGEISEVSVDDLKSWIKEGDTQRPFALGENSDIDLTDREAVEAVAPDQLSNNFDRNDAQAADAVEQSLSDPAREPQASVTLKADGQPFQTRRAVELSKRFRDTPNAQPIEVEGGWGFSAQNIAQDTGDAATTEQEIAQSEAFLETQTEESLAQREQEVQAAEQAEADQRNQEAQRAQADRDAEDFVLSGSNRNADIAESRGQNDIFSTSPSLEPATQTTELPLAPKDSQQRKPKKLTPRQQLVSDAFGGAMAGDTIKLATDVGYSKAGDSYTVDSINKDGTLQATSVERGSSVLISQGEWTQASRRTKAPLAEVANKRSDKDARFVFTGESAANVQKRALVSARQRAERGENLEEIRRETGWFQGSDGRWRFEIDDSNARFLAHRKGIVGELWTESLDQVLDHPALFAAYPGLREISVVSARGMGEKRGHYDATRGEIVLNAERSSMDQFSTLLHEIQHGIQRTEGFASGGNPRDYRLPPLKEKWLRQRIDEMSSETSELAKELRARYQAGEISLEDVTAGIQQRAEEIGLNDLRQQLNQGDKQGAYRRYQRLAGEVEARNVQARQGMSADERRATPPAATADVPDGEALVVYNGREFDQAPPPANAVDMVPPNDAPYVRDLAQKLAEHPALAGVKPVQSVSELPSRILDTMEARGIDAGKVAGVYDPTSGESFVVADNLMDTEEGVRRAVHEAVGHQGIHGVLGADLEKVMLQVYQSYRRSTSGNDTLREVRRAYPYLNPETDAGKVGIAEELVARSIERSDGRPALRTRVMAAIRSALRGLFPGVAWTDADIQVMGERARRYMQNRQNRQWKNADDPAASLGLRSVVRASGGEAGVSVSEAQRTVDAFMARYQGNVPLSVRVAATQEELYGPQATMANVGRLKGAYHPAKGVMTIVAGNARGVRDIQRTLRHEILGHYGLNTFAAGEKRVLLDRILETQDSPSLAPIWETVRRNYADAPLDIQAEEVFAHVAEIERTALGQVWDRVLAGLQRALRVTGLSRGPLRLSEIHDVARRIGEGIREGRRSQQVFPATDQEQFSRETPVDEPSIRFSLKDKQPDSVAGPYGPNDSTGFALPDESWLNATLRIWADKMRPLKRLRRAIQQEGGTIEEEADPYLAEELYHGRLENDLETFRRQYVEPLAEGMAKAKISQADLDNYVYALHAPERNAVVAERNPNDPSLQDGGSGMSNAEAAEIIEKAARSGKQAAYDRLAKIIHDITAVRRQAIRDGGLETDDVMDAWEATYQSYVPLKGFANDEPEAPRIGKGFQITGKESFMVKGRRDRAASPSTQAIVDANMSLIRRRKNEVGNAFLSMVTDHPNPELWQVFTDESPDTERSTVRVTDPETGEKRWEVREQPVQMRRDDRYFKTKRAGRTYYIKVKDQRLLNAMRNVGPEKLGWLTRTAGAATRIMSSLMTSYSPEFLVTNFERDIQTALLNIGAEQTRDDGRIKGQRILVDTARDVRPAMRAAWRGLNRSKASNKAETREWDRWFREFIEDGAKTGYFDMKDIDAQAKEISSMVRRADGSTLSHMLKARKKTADFVENINGAVENAVRLSAYVNSRRNGLTRRQAASLAKNLTVNFNRRGEIGTGLNAAYMFANASIQGTMNFARVMVTLKNTPEGKSPMNVWARFNLGQKIGFGMASTAFALATLNRLLSDEDDDGVLFWDKVPDHVKERHYVIMTGWATGNPEDYVKIPLPYGYNVFAVTGTHLEAVIAGTETPVEAAKNLGLAVAGSFSPIGFEDSESLGGLAAKNLTPTLARSLVQLGWNEDFAARMIYRENDSYGIPSPESSLYMRSTPGAYKAISQVLNDITGGTQNISGGVDINPDVIQHLVNYYGGGAWSFVEKTVDFAARSVTGQEVENYRTPFVGKVLGTVTPYQDQSLFYERRNELGQIFREAENRQGQEGVEFRAENREQIRLYLDAVDISNNLRDLRQERDIIEASDNLDDETKRDRLESVEERMKFQVDRFNRQYNALN